MINCRPSRKILILGSSAKSLTNFRGSLIKEILNRGHEVVAVANDSDERVARTLAEWDASFQSIGADRTGMNPASDLQTIARLVHLFKAIKPQIFLGYTPKAVAYGLLSARLVRVPHRYAMITGLGYAFTEGSEIKRKLARGASSIAYRLSVRLAEGVIFQNADDREEFRRRNFISSKQRILNVNGSGVDLKHFSPRSMPAGPPVFLMISRLLRDKGVVEYVEAARIVKRELPEARFVLVGPTDSNPSAIKVEEIARWVNEGIIEYQGEMSDVRPAIAGCHVFVLPSAYREGLPRTILEAMAMGRPVITTDTIGCRDAVRAGETGLLVPVRSVEALARAMNQLAVNAPFRAMMAKASLARAKEMFDSDAVARDIADFMNV